jgi:myo-inositol-1(or 4)-monophosphatase
MSTPELSIARRAAAAAGEVLLRHLQAGVSVRRKSSHQLVSDADIEAERAVVKAIRQAFPSHAIVGEEEQKDDLDAEHVWVIDPLDGTNNFVHRVPNFSVSIAYYRAGVAECGVVFGPVHEEWYSAARGQGAYFNNQAIHVSQEMRLNEILIGVGFYNDDSGLMDATLAASSELMKASAHGIRRMGSAALDLCAVACGQFGAFFEYELSPWDYAAGRLIVEEAGGRVTDARGGPLLLGKGSVLASNVHVHEAVLEIVRRHYREGEALPS